MIPRPRAVVLKRVAAGWAVAAVLALFGATAAPSGATAVRDYDVADGHYYEQAAWPGAGFVVRDDEGAPFWGELRRLGGPRALGYPISRRYDCDGAICQAFQHAVFKWPEGTREVELLSIFDWLHFDGRDDWLDEAWGIPPWQRDDGPPPKNERERRRREANAEREAFALLESNPSLNAAYWRLGPMAPTVYGLPRAYRATDELAVVRTQRAALVQAAARPGQVWLLPAGQVFKDAGLVPAEALAPEEAPEPIDASPPTWISVPELGVEAEVIPLDMGPDGELPTPDNARVVAWYSYGARLGEGGNAVLAGHVDWNRERGVFWRLGESQPGQTVTLHGGAGRTYDYRVDWVRQYRAESLPSLAALRPGGGANAITLVTCSGRFDVRTRMYEDRQVVRATLVGQRS